jgi:hypothetical protein
MRETVAELFFLAAVKLLCQHKRPTKKSRVNTLTDISYRSYWPG